MASVRDIAKQAGVSTATVSRVLNNHPRVSDEVRDKVMSAANESRYVPTVGKKSTTNIAFLYTGQSTLGSPFDASLLEGMNAGMEKYNYDLMLLDAKRARLPQETWSQMFIRKGIRGVVLRTDGSKRGVCEEIADEGFPCVVIGEQFENPSISYIYSDSRGTSQEAVEHLIGLGHQRIAMITNVVDDSDHRDRLAGYKQALADADIAFDTQRVYRSPANRMGGTQVLRRVLMAADRPTAMFIADPAAAVGVLNEAHSMGVKIPDELSVVGFDDGDIRYTVYPQLTAVCQDAKLMGQQAFDALYTMLDEEKLPSPIRSALPTWLEIHGTTGPAPA